MLSRVAVIGGGLGGMTAAGELAKVGCRVTLFDQGPVLGGKAAALHRDGITLDTGPTLLTLPEIVRAAFRRLGAEDLLPRFLELPLHCTYHFADDERLVVHRDLDRTLESAAAFGGGEASGLRAFYSAAAAIHRTAGEPYLEAPLEGPIDYLRRVARRGPGALLSGARMGTLAELAARHLKTSSLRQFVGRFATYAGASPYRASAAFALIPHLELVQGVHHVQGGMNALAVALGQAIARLGVEIQLGVDAEWHKESSGFSAGSAGATQHFDAVVVNADPLAALGRTREPLALSGYVLLLSVNRRLSLPHHTVSFSRDYPGEFAELFAGRVPDDATLYICHPAASDPAMAPDGASGLFLMLNAPPLPRAWGAAEDQAWREAAVRLREQCLRVLRRLCPEVAGAQVAVLGERTPVDWARRGAPGGSIYGFLPHGRLGPFRRPRLRGGVPGLFFSGGGTHPGGGVPLVMLSGHFAAELAAKHLELAS